MATILPFKLNPIAQPGPQAPEQKVKTATTIQEIVSYLLGQAEAAGLSTTAHALALAAHCAGKELRAAEAAAE
ncbi:MAG: hypothetical protein ACM31L_09410 [Actinomycetota bacterium]